MRLIEQQRFGGQRSSRHDAMCVAVASRPELIFPRFTGEVRVTIEAPLGHGFADLLAVTEAPPNEVQAAIIEVKTRDERCSAGDVIRQLKWYRANLPERLKVNPVRLIVVVENVDAIDSVMLGLLAHEGVEVLPVGWFEGMVAA